MESRSLDKLDVVNIFHYFVEVINKFRRERSAYL